ncbi:hypothetical protein BC937DRAFT_91265 [Endogone sp. FLAS-F59071]|nr:hypothetical protein BC937DRAFT_91265 [Endogone sp. FLAS-F59071]|eukprot:RUS16391.1 hypothetical protein BC937DRAFT_91265 [Endogone sp. FLAS-F59071]
MSLKIPLASRILLRASMSIPKQRPINTMLRRNYTAAKVTLPVDTSVGHMLRYQKAMPKLPVPALSATLDKYLRSVRPLLSDADYAKTVAVVEEFRAPGGPGEKLQERLLAKAQDTQTVNWLEDWWNDLSYFGYRDSVVIYVSYFFAYRDDRFRKTPAARAASLVTAALEFRKQVVNQTLEYEHAKNDPLCMYSYKWMFNACRMPAKPSDYEMAFDPATNNHIVAVRHNQFYVIETQHDGRQLSTAELEVQFAGVLAQAGDKKDPSIGVLTSENRDVWTDYRDLLIKAHPAHKAALEKIESSIFLVCLDDTAPVTRDELSRACWHGDGRNRYYDKSLQFIVFENGKAGFMGEVWFKNGGLRLTLEMKINCDEALDKTIPKHSSMDGTPTSRLNDYVLDALAKNKVDHGSSQIRSNLPTPTKLQFHLNHDVHKAIDSAGQSFDDLIASHDQHVLAYNGYGKNVIKRFSLSPDAYAQMVIQLAYYKMFGASRPTYESAQTRKFQHGRTETCRTVSLESVAWVKAMEDPSVPTEKKALLGREAIKSHIKYMADAVEGRGVDRHLLGLRLTLKPDETKPAIFTDPAYAYSSHWYLSTSQLTSEYFEGYGWGEVQPDGFGIAYMIKNNSLHFNVASRKDLVVHGVKHVDATQKMRAFLEEAADDMRQLFETELAKEPVKAKL